jgi:hypothetical protein
LYPVNANQHFPMDTGLGLRPNHHKCPDKNAKRAEPSAAFVTAVGRIIGQRYDTVNAVSVHHVGHSPPFAFF